jgi:hypothetical protein
MNRTFTFARFAPMAIAAALCTMSGPQVREAHAAPAGLSQQRLDLELREVEVKNVFKLLGEVGGRKLQLDPCVTGTVDIKLKNTPVPMVFDALASKLGLVYEDQGGDVLVRCAGDAGKEDARLATKVSITVKEAALQSVLEMLASSAKLDGVDYRATSRPKVTITLEGVRVSTALAALADGTNLKLGVARGKPVVSD